MQLGLVDLLRRMIATRRRERFAMSKSCGRDPAGGPLQSTGLAGRSLALGVAACVASLTAVAGLAAAMDENQTAYQRRDDAMKELGRSFTTNIGRVVSGRLAFSPDTVGSAENVLRLASTLPTLFPKGSDIAESHLKSELFAAPARVDEMLAAVQVAATALVPAVRNGDKAEIAAAYKVLNDACNACHVEFRKPYE
ncbi:Cytochrome c556 [Rhizobiales bacterium GAS191]|jgi:cytochrome c556|nr:Cytochrome c556 [Rhizobiales bacterium GAS113]SEE08296.1 Cytochrome c556 [Rhizobiales bacterium GAS191]SEE45712.1 Cytochrome c556 [Rhizobiales bacterium GAS188]